MISFSCPSRGRPELAKRLVETAESTAKHDVEILFYLNDDDPKLAQYKDLFDKKYYTVGPNQSTCYSWNILANKSKHDIVMLMGDDVQVQTQDWDQLILEQFSEYKDKILMIVPSDGRMKGTMRIKADKPTLWGDTVLPAAHFAVHKNWINTLGYLAPPFFWHWHVDTYTQKLARKVHRCLYMPNVVFKAKKMFDETGSQVRSNLNINNRDNFVWKIVRDRYLQQDVKHLKDFITNHSSQ
jgi:hypothetical protein